MVTDKTDEEVFNILKKEKSFDNCKIMCATLGFEYDKNHPSTSMNKLSLYCKWHKDDKKILIDDIFNKPIPYRYDYKYSVGQKIKNKFGEFVILKKYRKEWDTNKDNHKYRTYLCKCLNDDYEFELRESHIDQGIGCPKCGGRKAIFGYNTIYDLRKDLLKYIVNIEDAKTYTIHSGKKILCQCPICGHSKMVVIANLSSYGFSCSYCSDGISYPNKFIRNLLNQLNVKYVPEQRFSWSDNKVYDFYLEDYNCIIEAHGMQHYKDTAFSSKEYQEENDDYKKRLAQNNSIKHYVILDCRESNMNFIKNSIITSDLFQILSVDSSVVNWLECDQLSSKTIVRDVCFEWIKNHNITELSKQFNLNPHTIISYLEKGTSFGICNYVKGNRGHMRNITRNCKSKPILCKDLNILFYSKKECEEYFVSQGDVKFKGRVLYHYIKDEKMYHGHFFTYISKPEYNDIKKMSTENNSQYCVYGDYYYIKGA